MEFFQRPLDQCARQMWPFETAKKKEVEILIRQNYCECNHGLAIFKFLPFPTGGFYTSDSAHHGLHEDVTETCEHWQ